jgi:ABC-type antimicrobial peptide transport system permease subunit
LTVTAAGVAIGLACALAASRLMASMAFHVSPVDPIVLIESTPCLAAVAGLAAYLPARRATAVDPRTALQ